MSKITKRILALVLCLVMLVGVMPVGTLAEDTVEETTLVTEPEDTTAPSSEATDPSEPEGTTAPSSEPEGTTAPSSEPTNPSEPEGTTAPSSEPTGSTESAVVAVTGITLDVTALDVCVGAEPVTLTATVTPEDATDKTVTWKSSDEEVATVDENGTVTFRMIGDAVITATAGEFSASCAVSVILDEGWITGYANGDVIDAAIFCSDVHGNPSTVKSVFNGIKNADPSFNPSTASFVGDTQTTASSVTSAAQSVYSGLQCIYAFGNHDDEGDYGIADFTGLSYGSSATNYYIYTISENDMSTSSPDTSGFTSTVSGLDKTKPLFIISHMPLHSRRGDNNGAAAWYTAISAAAESMDIFFFWAHNHTSEGSADTAAYYVAKGGSETITVEGGSTVTPNFTYANAGYIDPPNTPDRNNVATAVRIYDDSVNLTVYNASGELSGTYAVNETVTREFASGSSSGGDSGETTDPTDPDEGGESGGTTTTTGTVYVLTDTVTTGKNYLIVDSSTVDGTGNILINSSGSFGNTTATIKSGDLTISGTTSTETYIELSDSTAVWTAGTSSSSTDVTCFSNAAYNSTTYYLYHDSGALSLNTSTSKNNWTVESNQIHYTGGGTTYYLNYSDGWNVDSSATSANVYIYEETTIDVETAVTLSSIAVTTVPNATTYNVGDTFSTEGMVVTATYSNGSAAAVTGYTVSEVDMTTAGTKTVTVTYTDGEVTKETTFEIVVNEVISEDATVTAIEVTGGKTEYTLDEAFSYEGLTVTATYDDNGTTKTKVLSEEEYTVTEPDMNTEGEKTVTVSYTYNDVTVYDEYTITVTEAESNDVTLGGTTTTPKTKTVYVLTSSISSGTAYLIANTNSAGSGYVVANNSGEVDATSVTVKTDSTIGTYIELDDATDELWTVASGYTFKNGSYYLYPRTQNNGSLELNTSSRNWSYSNNRLGYTSTGGNQHGPGGSGGSSTTYYLYYNDGWDVSSTQNSVYFYVPTEVEYTETVDTTVKYTMRAENLKQVVDADHLTAELDFCLQGNGSDLTTLPSGGSYSFTVLKDEDGIIVLKDEDGIISSDIASDGTVNFTGSTGEATVKVAYTWTQDGQTHTVYKNVTVTATEPYYTIDITDGSKPITDEEGNETGEYESVTSTIAIKGVTDSHLYNLNHVLTLVGADGEEILADEVTWSSSDTSIATVDSTGQVSFTGIGGTVHITVSYKIDENTSVEDTVTITASKTNYYTPADGGDNFPAYPNEGSVRFDKTAQAVGNFSQTGMVQMELSMTGVPYTTENAMDVVVMLDMTGSMSDDGMEAAEEATKAFVETIVKNENGSYNDNRVAVYAFNSGSSSPYELVSLKAITSDAELTTANTAIDTASNKQATGGTPFDEAAKQCYDVLQAAKTDGIGDDRQQFCVFMSDGGPTAYEGSDGYSYYGGNNTSGDRAITSYIGGYTSSSSSSWTYNLPTEYYTDLMKADGVTVYTVGLLLQNVPDSPAPYSSMTASTMNSDNTAITTVGSHYYFTSTILKNMATDATKYIDIFDVDDADDATAKFQAIASEILQAATDVLVTDKIADEYTMVFDIPTGSVDIDDTLSSQEFYIEVLSYGLDANHERTTSTSLMKLYLGQSNGAYYAASDASGTAYAAPVFEKTTLGTEATLYYWTTTDISGEDGYSGISVTVDGITYYYRTDGQGEYNMTSGAYAYGTIDEATNTSEDLIIATPYFVYNAATRMLMWTAEKLSATELALTYFLYLDNSATEVSYPLETDPGTYPTNDYAYLIYTNYLDNRCYQEFPKPQMTWNGAQATYVFYLVNEAGQPVNKYGQVVDFANAVFVTAPVTESVVWNELTDEGSAAFDVEVVAEEVLPDGYTIYDKEATYQVHVYEDETGDLQDPNYFVINGSEENGSTSSTTKVYNTKAGTKYSAYGTYSSTEDRMDGFDFANTTVAFAVTWSAKLVPDAVVVDYGLPVGIDVLENDMVEATLNSISLAPYSNKVINTGIADSGFAQPANGYLTLSNGDTAAVYGSEIYYSQRDMTFTQEATFYYDAAVTYYEGSNKQTGYLYSSVTVIPATTIYYEDSFVELKTFNMDGTEITSAWTTAGTTFTGADAVQDTDRPGTGLLDDADNLYGSDGAYKECSEYSLGSAAMITVDETKYGTAGFSFYGTGFDVISLTSNQTGNIVINVTGGPDSINKYYFVDTYYGYARTQVGTDENGEPVYEWEIVENDPNVLYQVPVMKISGLVYGQYNVTITASYVSEYDHHDDGAYDFYLDAIRIYDPAGNYESGIESDVVADAYGDDHEMYPSYYELRNWLIDANTFDSLNEDDVIDGIVFIDGATADGAGDTSSISDYNNFGPNNELYLAPGQAVSFNLNAGADAPDGYEVDTVQIALKSVGGTAKSKTWNAAASTVNTTTAKTISTATDMYYDITALNGKTVVIMNAGEDTDAILSITNVKVTYKAAVAATGYNLLTASEAETTEGSGVFTVDVASAEAAVLSMRRITAGDIETEETESTGSAETTVPEDTEAPETETTEPEATEPEVTEPEDTESETNTLVETIRNVVQTVVNIISSIFSRWF